MIGNFKEGLESLSTKIKDIFSKFRKTLMREIYAQAKIVFKNDK